MNDQELAECKVTFKRNNLLGVWQWAAQTPHGPLHSFGLFVHKAEAERNALARLRSYQSTEQISGAELRGRVERQQAGVGE